MSRYRSQVREVVNRNTFVSLALAAGYNAFLPVYDGGIDLMLYREKDPERGLDPVVRKVQLKGRWTIDRKYVDRDLWVAFPIAGEWHLMPHDEMVRLAHADGVLDTKSWTEAGLYSRGRPSKAVIAACAPYRFGSAAEIATGDEEGADAPDIQDTDEIGGASAVGAFLPIFERRDFRAGEWCEPLKNEDGSISWPAFDMDPVMLDLLATCERHNWLKVQYDQSAIDIANGRTDGEAELAEAGVTRLAAVFAFLNSAERHTGGGRFSEAVERGLFRSIVRRAAKIADSAGRSGAVSPRDRIVGSILGGAVGDALGAPIEFLSLAEIRERHGHAGLQNFEYDETAGAITDDTQMTLFTAEGLIRAQMRALSKGVCSPPAVIHHAYLRWLLTQGESPTGGERMIERNGWLFAVPALHNRRAPGNTCLSALIDAEGWGVPERARNDSKGCGGVMRVAPIGLFAPVLGDDAAVFELGSAAAALTHGHPSGYLAAGHLAVVIAAVARGDKLEQALDAGDRQLVGRDGCREVADAVAAARSLARRGRPTPEAIETLGGGWVAEEALAIAICCALSARSFDDGVLMAANHSGDSDSTAAITGNVLGAMLGVGTIPAAWLERLELRPEIERIADDLSRVVAGERLGFNDYPPA